MKSVHEIAAAFASETSRRPSDAETSLTMLVEFLAENEDHCKSFLYAVAVRRLELAKEDLTK